jgi:hypothetical protein
MQQLVRFVIDREDSQKIEREAQRLGLKSADFLRLLIKLYFNGNGLRLERRELVHELEERE